MFTYRSYSQKKKINKNTYLKIQKKKSKENMEIFSVQKNYKIKSNEDVK